MTSIGASSRASLRGAPSRLPQPVGVSGRTGIRRPTIALRIALLAWLVSLVTMLVFVAITIPQQKQVFLQNLESKALGVVVALRDVAAGAAVTEDFASLVSASHSLISGDPSLDFLVINKDDGFTLLTQRSGWSVEQKTDAYWQPHRRTTSAGISWVPSFGLRSFHYAHPFDYSGIEWGWIHVGISLQSYDESVMRLYRNTTLLGLGCILFSLAASVVYARRMVRPLLRLRGVVQEIAEGDLQVRAEANRRDELGDLGYSVNIMTEALEQRDRQLQGVARSIQALLSENDPAAGIPRALEIIGPAAQQDRAYYFDLMTTPGTGEMLASQRYEWVASGIASMIDWPELQAVRLDRVFPDWVVELSNGKPVGGVTSQLPEPPHTFLTHQGVLSVLIIPVILDGKPHGFIGFDNCCVEYQWTDNEVAMLMSLAASVGTAIERYRFDQEILEAKATLEQRVQERTRELQDQVGAKEHALSELAAAQGTLVEMSRSAGMAEVATGVLHNVGNVLNSVNVSCNLIIEQLRESRAGNVAKVAELLVSADSNLAGFLRDDPRGQQIPGYLTSLGSALEQERKLMQVETRALHDRIEHIKEIVAMQQTYGRVVGLLETLPPEQLMEDALKLNAEALARHGIEVRRDYARVPNVNVDKHKVLQVLLNLINNAKHACSHKEQGEKIVTLRISSDAPGRLRMEVADNGVGISKENLKRIFQHGFTTRKGGHGFGLHSGALAARSLGGSLVAASDGLDKGAIFTLELPLNAVETA